jgi:hypothetical protein
MVKFHAQFDHIVLPSAPLETLVERLATRFNTRTATHPRSLDGVGLAVRRRYHFLYDFFDR